MHPRKPSQTACYVAALRALANDGLVTFPGFSDPFASSLLPAGWRFLHRLAAASARRASPEHRRRMADGIAMLPLRVAAIDAELTAAIDDGCTQVVVLGAGLDTRAYRMSRLAAATVFEVDHPATQAFKRERAASLRPTAGALAYVAVDFERDSLLSSLVAAGFRTGARTAWVWEGVVMYLTDEAVDRTLADVAKASAARSALIVNYHVPDACLAPAERRSRRLVLSLWREPQIGQRSPEAMRSAVVRAGFEVTSDSGPLEWAQRFGAPPVESDRARVARLLVAQRVAP